MKIKLTGFTRFTSKDGKDCIIIGCIYKDPFWQGFRTFESFVSANILDVELKLNSEYNLDLDRSGRVMAIEPIN